MLSWQRDPLTTMSIDWHTLPEQATTSATLRYRRQGDSEAWRSIESQQTFFKPAGRVIHRVELTGLEPDTHYQFQIAGYDRLWSFRTLPRDLSQRQVVFALGGDTGPGHAVMRQINVHVMARDPDFIVWGGDLAHDNGELENWPLWDQWFAMLQESLVTPEGRVVPIVLGIGNHEVHRKRGGNHYYLFPEFKNAQEFEQYGGNIEDWRRQTAPFFYSLFAFPGQPGYGVLDFGQYLSLFVLDSDHTNPVEGKQTQWLARSLEARAGVTHRIPVYHVPAYPSVRIFDGRTSRNVREHWSPLFEQHGVKVAFEHHDHASKRTVPIRQGKEDASGTVYLGDGPWGALSREPVSLASRWYLSHARSERHAYIITLGPEKLRVQAINASGQIIDEHPFPQIGLDRTGLRDADKLAAHIASLLQDHDPAMRSAARQILVLFARTYQPDQPTDRSLFLKELLEIFSIQRDADAASRLLAYQLLLMHADYLENTASTAALLQQGLKDTSLPVTELAQVISSLDPRKDAALLRQSLQAMGSDAVIDRREQIFTQQLPPTASLPQTASPSHVHRLPVTGWKLQWDHARLGHIEQWFAPSHDDSQWEDAAIETPWTTPLQGEPHVGIAWYRLKLTLPGSVDAGQWSLKFEGVDEEAWVWFDGAYIGRHDQGAAGYDKPFEFPVPGISEPGRTHVLTVRVRNTRGAGGIWRPVSLLVYPRQTP